MMYIEVTVYFSLQWKKSWLNLMLIDRIWVTCHWKQWLTKKNMVSKSITKFANPGRWAVKFHWVLPKREHCLGISFKDWSPIC